MKELYMAFVDYAIWLTALIVPVVAVFVYRKLNPELKIFSVYLVMSSLVELGSEYLSRNFGTNLPLLHIFVVLEISLLGLFFTKVFSLLKSNFPVGILSFIVAILCIGNTLFLQPIDVFNTYAATLVSLVIIIFCVLTFSLLLEKGSNDFPHIKGVVSGLLIYQMPTFLVLSSANILMHLTNSEDSILWFARAVLIFISKLIFLYVLYRAYFLPKGKLI